ncbi:MAG: DUF3153 domain-containing protein [Aphanocapsa lilacina HA4352-LM1]|jgi:hypothetical protein|nr:DUF3153 domain-containing protein [Aphanocapsa lilacina HA4352-LM1]
MSARALLACLLGALLLSGCVSYRLGISFNWLGGGTVEQILAVDRNLVEAGGEQLDTLVAGLERRTAELGGTSERTVERLRLRIPFEDGADLESKLNRFLGRPLETAARPTAQAAPAVLSGTAPLPAVLAKDPPASSTPGPLQLVQRDRWLWSEYDVSADLDLRSPFGTVRVGNWISGLIQLEFALTTPLPAFRSNSDEQQGQTLLWRIRTGEINHLEASFIVPNLPLVGLICLGVLALAVLAWQQRKFFSAR